jgi:hypothetical protein
MKFIELHANNRIYLINPVQIIQAVGEESTEPPYITVMLADPSQSGTRSASAKLVFKGDDALQVFEKLRMVGVM